MISWFGTPSNVVDIRNSFSLSVVIAYYWYYIHLFDKNYARSFIYNSVTERQRRRFSLIGCMLLRAGDVDGLICGTWGVHAAHLFGVIEVTPGTGAKTVTNAVDRKSVV